MTGKDNWTDRDYGLEDGAADFDTGRVDATSYAAETEYGAGYREGYDAALAASTPDNVKPVTS